MKGTEPGKAGVGGAEAAGTVGDLRGSGWLQTETRGRGGANTARRASQGEEAAWKGPQAGELFFVAVGVWWLEAKWKEVAREIQVKVPWGRPVECRGPGSPAGMGEGETPTC